MIRIGIGYDIHRLVSGRKLFLGGIKIRHPKGLLGHSDADTLLHAVCDALLGAAGQRDIGELFPDTEPKYKNISSLELLKAVGSLLKKKRFNVVNIDCVIIAQEPKILPYKKKMREKIAAVLKIRPESVNIKGKTSDGLGEIGRKKAIASYAAAMIIRRS